MPLDQLSETWERIISAALDEDRYREDVSVGLLGEAAASPAVGRIVAQESLVLAGVGIAGRVFESTGQHVSDKAEDGERLDSGDTCLLVEGTWGGLLSAERTALNFLQHLSGIATATRKAVDSVRGTRCRVLDTRKTIPGLRSMAKYAVRVGGGHNHRETLADAIFWKDNHWEAMRAGRLSLSEVLEKAGTTPVVVEVDDEDELIVALEAGADHILADNQSPETISRWKTLVGKERTLEASGGITLESLRSYAEAGADCVSMGALTHTVSAAAMGMEITPVR